MKTIFLSFRPEYFKPILYGMKKYEYRKRFCHEETKAYLYLSGKKRMVVGIMELGIPIRLDEIRESLKNKPEVLKRVDRYISNRDVCAIPIKSLTLFKQPISLTELRKEIPNFFPPQIYYVLNDDSAILNYLKKCELRDTEFTHNHDELYYDNLAVSVSEMIETVSFKKIDSVIDKMTDYKDIL